MCALLGDGPAYLVCGAGAEAGGQQLGGRQGEAELVVRHEILHAVQDWVGQQLGQYLDEGELQGSGGAGAAAGGQERLLEDLGSSEVWELVGAEDYLVRCSGLLLGGRQPAEEAGGPGEQVSAGPVQLGSGVFRDRVDYLAVQMHLLQQGGEEGQRQHSEVGR